MTIKSASFIPVTGSRDGGPLAPPYLLEFGESVKPAAQDVANHHRTPGKRFTLGEEDRRSLVATKIGGKVVEMNRYSLYFLSTATYPKRPVGQLVPADLSKATPQKEWKC